MSDATFETFLVSGLLVLIAAIVFLAWSAWRWLDRARDMDRRSLDGIAHEYRLNLKRLLTELAGVANGTLQRDIDIVPVIHPQLDAILARPSEADRRGLSLIRANYNELAAHKASIRHALSNQTDVAAAANLAVEATIGAIANLYLWEEHKGLPPEEAQSTRSWSVRDWMKTNHFQADSLPGLHLRDQVVKRLRTDGMMLTPRPLTHTAHEFYSMQYDRKADPNAPFWKRKSKPAPVVEAGAEADTAVSEPAPIEPPTAAPEAPTAPEAPAAPAAAEPSAEPAPSPTADPSLETATTETAADPVPAPKPPTPGSVH